LKQTKPFCVSKREVWEAYKRVRANRGCAGFCVYPDEYRPEKPMGDIETDMLFRDNSRNGLKSRFLLY